MHDPMVVAFDIPRPWPRRNRFSGRRYWPALITVWHVEPGGHDAFEVCKHSSHWQWHVWHWKVQIRPLQQLKRFLFERCIECGRRYPWGYSPVSHQWDGPGSRWFRVQKLNYHHECSGLVSLRRGRESDEKLIRHLFAGYRLAVDLDEAEALAQLTNARNRTLEFSESYRLTGLLGYERGESYELVRKSGSVDV
jgi:hypothetical protein